MSDENSEIQVQRAVIQSQAAALNRAHQRVETLSLLVGSAGECLAVTKHVVTQFGWGPRASRDIDNLVGAINAWLEAAEIAKKWDP